MAQLPAYAIVKSTTDKSSSKFDFLKEELKNAQIVLLGEPSHSPHYFPIKTEVVKYLHENLGFDVLAFESGLYQMDHINKDIKKGKDIQSAFEEGLFPIWTSTDEFKEIYPYLESHKLDIAGFDCQMSGTIASKTFVKELDSTLVVKRIPFKKSTLQVLQAQLENLETGTRGLTEDFSMTILDELRELNQAMSSVPSLVLYNQSLAGWIGHFKDLYYNNIFHKANSGLLQAKDSNVRDSLMAVNMKYLYESLFTGRKIIGWGANLHFIKSVEGLVTGHADSHEFVSMGSHLKNTFGDKVFILAVTTDENYSATFEYHLAKQGPDLAWISMANNNQKAFSSNLLGEPATGIWSDVVDGILYFRKESLDNNALFINGKVINDTNNEGVSYASISIDGTDRGTASDDSGHFRLKVDSLYPDKIIKVSCIGFKTKTILLKNLLNSGSIYLTPEPHVLKEVIVNAKAPDAKEILELAINKIADNYCQEPFNMEFYSTMHVLDTLENQSYYLECVFASYYEGYKRLGKKNYKILQKREGGNYYMKEKTHGLSLWPMWELAFNDLFSNQARYQFVTVEGLNKIDPKLIGVDKYDGDTVYVIKYHHQVEGILYVSSRDHSILKHIITVSGKGFKNRTELIYKKQGDKYYPYVATGNYLHEYKVGKSKKYLKINNKVFLRTVKDENVDTLDADKESWYPRSVKYNEEFWNLNYPRK